MPGESFHGPLPPLTADQQAMQKEFDRDLARLCVQIGERNLRHAAAYAQATEFVEQQLKATGHDVTRQVFDVKGRPCVNLELEITGNRQPAEIVVVGAHYDSAQGTPAANDNGSGVVALLALARRLKDHKPARTLRLVAFANEEPPYFQTDAMGSLVYAKQCQAKKEKIVAMLSLETMGYFSDAADSQKYPAQVSQFYPNTGNFIAFVGNIESRSLVEHTVATFRQQAKFPCEGGAMPGYLDGVGWSDHWSFWQCGYPGVMVTDTALFRYPHYHKATDTPDKVDTGRLARVVSGLQSVIVDLANPRRP
ncbi:MAG: M28 family peptidase [Planctomycetia bacterium]|nr:M28 family peptidase [Planctomycetia bacterium]